MNTMNDHLWFMRLALEQAEIAWKMQEVPIGAVIVNGSGEVIAKSHNLKEITHNPCGHAELLCIQDAAQKSESWRPNECRIYVTLEPCTMCMAALAQARIKHLIFGAYDAKGGALSLGYNLNNDKRLNHRFPVTGGVMHFECSKVLSDFFKQRRSAYGNSTHSHT